MPAPAPYAEPDHTDSSTADHDAVGANSDPAPVHGLTRDELARICASLGAPRFRTDQIWRWLYVQGVTRWQDMLNLPRDLRQRLSEALSFGATQCVEATGRPGETRKLLLELQDQETIETVIIPARNRLTVCVSTQVGCRYRCAFCASGQAGFRRNLSAGEIVEQVLQAGTCAQAAPTHVVFMGVGEPLDNYEQVLKSVRILNDSDGLNIGARRITISTCGVVPGIRRLAEEGLQIELSVSLHASRDELRERLMPVAHRYRLNLLMQTCADYVKRTGRIITFEYTLIGGVNDSGADADALARVLRILPCRVNLIPLSTVREFDGKPAPPEAADMFLDTLTRAGINATLRASRGAGIKAACGQLRAGRG